MRWNLGALALLGLALPAAAETLPPDFVYLRDVAPAIAQDMRYASVDNFTGHPLPGYRAGECVLRRDAALALARVEADLARQHLALKTYDCYRPTRAVRAMLRWSRRPEDDLTQRFYPTLEKRKLFALGYIAYHSRHSTGIAVDLTLVPQPAPHVAAFDPHARYGACTAPAAQRAPDVSLDMGTGFDCFDLKSRTRSPGARTGAAAAAYVAGCRHAPARLPQLFPRMVALRIRERCAAPRLRLSDCSASALTAPLRVN